MAEFNPGLKVRVQFRGQCHGAHGHKDRDILGTIGDSILHRKDFEQVTAVHRHEQAARKMVAQIVFDLIGLELELGYLLL